MNFFDDNDEKEKSEENLRYFYEEYSAGIKKQLLSKNLMAPQNVYDVLYPRTKELLLSKNIPKITDLEEDSKSLRDALIAKIISSSIDLDAISETARKTLLARNKIIEDSNKLLNASSSARKNLLAKNTSSDSELLKDSASFRENNVSKNGPSISEANSLENSSEEFKNKNMSKNVSSTNDLLENSQDFKEKNTSKNVESNLDLEKDSKTYASNNLSKNVSVNKADLESIGQEERDKSLSKNKAGADNLLENSEVLKNALLSKNAPSETSIDSNFNVFQDNNLNKNTSNNSDLDKDSEAYRKNNLSNSTGQASDLSKASEAFREKNTSKNTSKNSDLETDSEIARANALASNNSVKADLEELQSQFRKNNLSNNDGKSGSLEEDSEEFRKNNLSYNKNSNSDLLADSEVYVKNNTAANTPSEKNLLDDSVEFLKNNTASNKPTGSDLIEDSKEFLSDSLSMNKEAVSDLEKDSEVTRQKNLSNNTESSGDLVKDSEAFLKNNVSNNKANNSDLLADSSVYLNNNTSLNTAESSDLLDDSQQFLENNLSSNSPDTGDLLTDSQTYLEGNLAPNVPDNGDLLTDSQIYLNDNLAPNVPDNGDLLDDSQQFLDNNLSANSPDTGDLLTDSQTYLNNNISANSPDTGDLLTDSQTYLNNNLSSNVPDNGNLLNDSSQFYQNNVASNVNNSRDLEAFSKPFRDNNLAANPPVDPLGIVVEGIGTAAFVGISRVMTQGIVIRQILKAKNKPSKYNLDNFVSISTLDRTSVTETKNTLIAKNQFQLGNAEYNQGNALGLTSSNIPGFFGKDVSEEVAKSFNKIRDYNRVVATSLQLNYGTNSAADENKTSPIQVKIGGGFFATNSVSPKGGEFLSFGNTTPVEYTSRILAGSITDAIRNYNLSRNLYNLYKITPGNLESMTTLKQHNDEGFQDLLAKTIGHLKGNDGIGSQLQGNLIPRSLLVANEGAYIKGSSPETAMRPQQGLGIEVGTAASMMSKTVAGNPLLDTEFQAGVKGVSHILKTIKNSDAANFTINYDVQNAKKFVIGTTSEGAPKFARQRFTVANPYKPGNAKSLLFYIQNYSSGDGFYFPPYVKNYSDSYGANWNSVNFLGRPEAVYTYNNSTRNGSISFVVLTDYTQNLIIGKDFNSDGVGDVKVNPNRHFTSKDAAQNKQREMASNQAEAKQQETNNTKKEYKNYSNIVSGGTPESAVLQQDIDSLQKQANSIQKAQEDALISANNGTVYSETNNVIGNINDFMTTTPARDAGSIDTKAGDSKKRIDQMIQNLAFQPAFFSGDKVDFLTKMEFLAKLTRPAKADEGSGFSFTRPPVCRIQLGDWWNNDIIIDSVDFNYDDVPWTLDEGRVQPMWAVVNINFKFVGPYRGQKGGPVLSTDNGGFYQNRG